MEERYSLSLGRIRELAENPEIVAPFDEYFRQMALFLLKMDGLYQWVKGGYAKEASKETLEGWNKDLYKDIMPLYYECSYANPDYAVTVLGEKFGRILSFLYTELRSEIVYAYEQRLFNMVILNELFLEIYSIMRDEEPSYRQVKEAIYWFFSDYSEVTVRERVGEQLDKEGNYAVEIIMNADLTDTRYLYSYGEYISENETKMAEYMNSLTEEQIHDLAFTYTDGYREGFSVMGIDISKKRLVEIRYPIGMERVVREAIKQFKAINLEPVIYRNAVSAMSRNPKGRVGYVSTSPNRQYEYDHRYDMAVFFDKAFIDRKLQNLKAAYDDYKEQAAVYGGPAVMMTFGEVPFTPEDKANAYRFNEKQQKLYVEYASESGKIVNQYINPLERSFTIIAYPVPEIGDNFEEIFDEIVKVNTLDKDMYREIQQNLIDALDQGEFVHILGKGDNKTDLYVAMADLNDPSKETLFENCLADINIPVGEVFTSPKLAGTNGILHVTGVYLNELFYKNLEIHFKDGMISDYNCTNFLEEESNKAFLRENVLFHHDTLPLGEFAIATNTTAYQMAKDYGIEAKLPILIAEKMGPHFAVGDTCYSHSEEKALYNPNGKEVIARENECSLKRFEDESKAYFNCHTDITIPYDELGLIEVVRKDGTRINLIEDGRFVLPGTEELNKAFHD